MLSGDGLCVSATMSLIVSSPSSEPDCVGLLNAFTAFLMIRSFFGLSFMWAASSSTLGRRLMRSLSSRVAYFILLISSTMYAGMWIGWAALISARLIACLIHQLA